MMARPGFAESLQRDHRVTLTGPTNFLALLNSLQMGFRTLAIQKRSSEVWRVLGEAKAEFQRYAEVWDKLDKQLQTAQKTIQDVGIRTRAVERKLRQVEVSDLPAGAQVHLELASPIDDGDSEPVQLPVRRLQ
jgi:DNA recombination protein RmuC